MQRFKEPHPSIINTLSTYLISDSHFEINQCLEPRSIPNDWYVALFDEVYIEIDQKRKPPDITQIEVNWIERIANVSRPLRILDLACGYGRHAIELARRGHSVVGIDLSIPLLNKAELDAKKQGVRIELYHQDIRKLPNEQFDMVISMHTSLGYFATPGENDLLIRQIQNLLSKDGVFVFDQIDFCNLAIRQEQKRESYVLKFGKDYQKISLFSESDFIWHGAYLIRSNDYTSVRPFRIWIQKDGAGKTRGLYSFADASKKYLHQR